MIRHILSLLFIAAGILDASADIVISGKVTDRKGAPVAAMVTVTEGDAICGFSAAEDNGEYSITLTPTSDKVTVRASYLGFEAVEKIVAARTQTLDITLTEGEKGIELKEVVVVADKITQRGDTLSYMVDAYKDAGDRVIGDVIKKMPGLEVSESGQISFNGKTVKNFYVEDMDLLQGRYGIATNNVSANDVASVQVYQNHQPIRALQDWSPSEEVTINIKLKSSARGTLTMNGMAGIGYKPTMWAAEAVAMFFGKKFQTITTYKGNNSGDNVMAEQNDLIGDGSLQFFNSAPLSVVSPGSPGVALKRYMRNRSNTVGTNNIFKFDSLSTLNMSLSYLDDIQRKEGGSVTEQYLPAGDYRQITQKIATKSHSHNLNGSATYKKNSSALYVSNTLNVKAGWSKDRGRSVTSASFMDRETAVDQFLDNPSFTIDDRLSIIANTDSHAMKFNIGAGWNHRPQTLTVSPTSIFGISTTGEEVTQDYTTDDFRGEFQTGLMYSLGKVKLYGTVFGDVDVERVTSALHGFSPEALGNTANDYTFGKGTVGLEPQLSYTAGDAYFELTLPLSYNGQWLRDRLDTDRNRGWNYLNFSPSLKMTYTFGKSWWLIRTSYYRMRDNSGRVAPGIVMTDYMSFREYLVYKTMTDKTWFSTLEYHYSNALQQVFGNAEFNWLRSSRNTMTGYEYDGLVTVRNVYDIPCVSNRYTATAGVSKGFGFWNSTLKLGGNYSLYTSSQILDRKAVDYKAQYWSSNLMLALTPAQWMGAALGFAYGESRSYTELNRADAATVRQYTGRLDLNFFPCRRLAVNVAVEDNYTNMTSEAKHAWFGDVRLKYGIGRFEWELEFNNIFNRREFTRVNYTDMNIYRSTYQLRPRNVMLKLRFKIL